MSNPSCTIAAILLALVCASCKTERTETWSTVSTDSNNPFGARMFGPLDSVGDLKKTEAKVDGLKKKLEEDPGNRRARRQLKKAQQDLAGQRTKTDHPLSSKRGGTEGIFGRDKGGLPTDKSFRTKGFRREEFAGKKEFDSENYHFLRERELSREAAAAADKRFLGGDRQAGEGGRRWFGREKTAPTGPLVDGEKSFPTSAYRDATDTRLPSHDTESNIIRGPGSSANSTKAEMSVDDVRSLLGR